MRMREEDEKEKMNESGIKRHEGRIRGGRERGREEGRRGKEKRRKE